MGVFRVLGLTWGWPGSVPVRMEAHGLAWGGSGMARHEDVLFQGGLCVGGRIEQVYDGLGGWSWRV